MTSKEIRDNIRMKKDGTVVLSNPEFQIPVDSNRAHGVILVEMTAQLAELNENLVRLIDAVYRLK